MIQDKKALKLISLSGRFPLILVVIQDVYKLFEVVVNIILHGITL